MGWRGGWRRRGGDEEKGEEWSGGKGKGEGCGLSENVEAWKCC